MNTNHQQINTLGIIGLGFMGASLAKSFKKHLPTTRCIGYDTNTDYCEHALNQRYMDEILPPEKLACQTDVLILATPVDTISQLLTQLLPYFTGIAITDTGSTKQMLCQTANRCANGEKYVAAHPFAGSAHTGPYRAHPELYTQADCFLCNTADSSQESLQAVASLFSQCGMNLHEISAPEHDQLMANYSHLPQLVSYALAAAISPPDAYNYPKPNMWGRGLTSMLRLAKSNPKIWLPIARQNNQHLVKALIRFEQQIQQMINSLEDTNYDRLEASFNRSFCLMNQNIHPKTPKNNNHE